MAKLETECESKDVTGLCQKITPGEYSSGYPKL